MANKNANDNGSQVISNMPMGRIKASLVDNQNNLTDVIQQGWSLGFTTRDNDFDDGFENNYSVVAPILSDFKITALVGL